MWTRYISCAAIFILLIVPFLLGGCASPRHNPMPTDSEAERWRQEAERARLQYLEERQQSALLQEQLQNLTDDTQAIRVMLQDSQSKIEQLQQETSRLSLPPLPPTGGHSATAAPIYSQVTIQRQEQPDPSQVTHDAIERIEIVANEFRPGQYEFHCPVKMRVGKRYDVSLKIARLGGLPLSSNSAVAAWRDRVTDEMRASLTGDDFEITLVIPPDNNSQFLAGGPAFWEWAVKPLKAGPLELKVRPIYVAHIGPTQVEKVIEGRVHVIDVEGDPVYQLKDSANRNWPFLAFFLSGVLIPSSVWMGKRVKEAISEKRLRKHDAGFQVGPEAGED